MAWQMLAIMFQTAACADLLLVGCNRQELVLYGRGMGHHKHPDKVSLFL
jgi:hypothetical protein